MKVSQCGFVLIALTILTVTALANDSFLIIVDNSGGISQTRLEGFPGRAWGKTIDKIYLYGDETQINWLVDRNIAFTTSVLDGEPSSLYMSFGLSNYNAFENQILDYSDEYVLAKSRLPQADSYRRLTLRNLPFTIRHSTVTDILDYHSAIDSLIGEVSQDTIIDMLTRLSGEAPIEIDGEIDTILTRYSGTEGNALAADYIKEILESYDYQTVYHAFFDGEMRNIAAYDESNAWMVDEYGDSYKTNNGGADWVSMPVNTNSSLWGIDNIGSDSVWVVGDQGAIRFSTDGGVSFNSQNSTTNNYLFGVSFISPSEGWIAGDYGLIIHTTNAGQNWSIQTTPTSQRLYDVCFVDSDYGWAVGRNGTIINTTNGGAEWTPQTSNTVERLYSVKFTDRNNGWLVGWSGVVRHTTNGGSTWQTVNLGDNVEKYHVDFTDSNHGCIVGWDGSIYITSNGGANWTEIVTGTTKDLYGVEFVNDQTGYAVGNGIVLKTTDGGQTWLNQSTGIEGAARNVVATKLGTTAPDEQVIMCAHFDNTSEIPQDRAPGADDNGSGTVAVIEAARLFADKQFEKTVKFCLWTGEEQGLNGSAAYAEDAFMRGDNIVGAFNFDMIAWDGDGDHLGELHCGTMTSSVAMGDLFEEVIGDYGIDMNTDLITFGSTNRSDHASFWDYNYPAILGIEDFSDDFHPHYHTTQDNMANINQDFFFEYAKAAIGAAATMAIPDTISTDISKPEQLPGAFALVSNYPNPFNAATTISFELPTKADIELIVYDILGQKVATLYEGTLNTGSHQLTWNANNYASGLYFYKLDAGDYSAKGRMTLLK